MASSCHGFYSIVRVGVKTVSTIGVTCRSVMLARTPSSASDAMGAVRQRGCRTAQEANRRASCPYTCVVTTEVCRHNLYAQREVIEPKMAHDQKHDLQAHTPDERIPASNTSDISTSALLVGSLEGEVALVRAHTGAIVWHAATGREAGTLAQDGRQAYVALGSRLHLLRRPAHGETRVQELERHARIQAEPARLEARAVDTGAVRWRREDWGLVGRLDVGATAGMVLVASTSVYGDRALYALDAATDATQWSAPRVSQMQVNDRRFVTHAGHVYLYGEVQGNGLRVLDARHGDELWRWDGEPDLLLSSPRGHLLLMRSWRGDGIVRMSTLDPATGRVIAERAVQGAVRAVSDDGVAYVVPGGNYDDPGLAAIRLADGAELWRVVSDDLYTYQIAVTEAVVYCGRLRSPAASAIGEITALDVRTGRALWRWHTPQDIGELLALWGRRTPQLLAVGAARAAITLAAAVASDVRERRIATLYHEWRWGQWRHPEALHGAVNAMWLAAWGDLVFLGTRLGIFAVDAETGRLRWHALPTSDLSFYLPALPPR